MGKCACTWEGDVQGDGLWAIGLGVPVVEERLLPAAVARLGWRHLAWVWKEAWQISDCPCSHASPKELGAAVIHRKMLCLVCYWAQIMVQHADPFQPAALGNVQSTRPGITRYAGQVQA